MIFNLAQVVHIREQVVLPRLNVTEVKTARSWPVFPPLLLFLVLLFQLSIRLQIISQGYSLEQFRSQALSQDSELRELRLKLAFATRPKHVGEKAATALGMGPLYPQRVRQILVP